MALNGVFTGGFEKNGCVLMVFRGEVAVFLWSGDALFSASETRQLLKIFFLDSR
jgi:hypothetical protein